LNCCSHVLKCCVGSALRCVRLYYPGVFNPEPLWSRNSSLQGHCEHQALLCDHNFQLEVISYTHNNTKNRAWYSHIQYLQAQLIPHYIELKPESALLYKWFNVAKKYAKVYLLRTERVVLAEVLVMSVGSSATHWMMPLSSAVRLCKVSLLVARDNAPLSSVISTLP